MIKQNKEQEFFVDKNHAVQGLYYDILDQKISDAELIKEMHKLIAQDKDFLDPYLVISELLITQGKEEEAVEILKKAYDRALMIIVDKNGQWPKEMPWGFLENRHILRTIEQQAFFYWTCGQIDEALNIFRKLLKMNPHDNQGIRYNILAIRMGLNFDKWQKSFEVIQDGQVVGLDGLRVSKWFDKNAPKFEDDFKWLLDFYKSDDSDI